MSPIKSRTKPRSRSKQSSKASRAEVFARLVENAQEGIYIGTISTTTTTVATNSHLKVMFGYTASTPPRNVRPFETERFVNPEARYSFLEELKRNGMVTDYLLRLRRVDATPMWVEVTARAELAKTSRSLRIEALIRNVTERKKLEDQTREELVQDKKLAALGQTVSSVAHELNNPLATILTWSERLAERQLDNVTRQGIETILGETERAAKIVRNLLTFARKPHTTRAMVDLSEIIRDTLSLRSDEQRLTNIAIIDKLEENLPEVFADPHQVQQVLLNLVENAEQAMMTAHGRGTIVLRTWHDRDAESVLLEIQDDGPGIPEDAQPRIFEPFFTTKDTGKGTGLGLTVAYAIMQEHGGQIRLVSNSSGGTNFHIGFPCRTVPIRDPRPLSPSPLRTDIGGGASALLVEDEQALATAVAAALTDADFKVDLACDGKEALKLVREANYDLVICDLKMPRLDGTEFYKAVAKIRPSLLKHIVFVTGDVVDKKAKTFLNETGSPWLAKPFHLADLLQVAREVLD